jgi:hypothetical protein
MNRSQPPPLAAWLLQRLASGSDGDAIAGDLHEQFADGRSRSWYWRQTLAAILVAAARDVREHKLLTLRALAIVWAALIPWMLFTLALYRWVNLHWVFPWINRNEYPIRFAFWETTGLPVTMMWCLGAAIIGWMAVRLHPRHRTAAALLNVASQTAFALWWAAPIWVRSSQHTVAYYRSTWRAGAVIVVIGMPLGALIGGLLPVSQDRRP